VPHVLHLWILPTCRGGLQSATSPVAPILPPYREGSGATTACPTVFCGPRASSVKKSLACLLVQLDTHVLDTRTHVP
jgi:hypothetical protein